MAEICADIAQQVDFDESVVCGLWQCEALRASQKGKCQSSVENNIPQLLKGYIYEVFFVFDNQSVWVLRYFFY